MASGAKSFHDILDDYRHLLGDVSASFTSWPSTCNTEDYVPPNKIKELVLKCQQVQDVMQAISAEKEQSMENIRKQAVDILDKLANDFKARSYRSLLYIVLKTFKRLFNHIYIDSQGLEQVKELTKSNRVIILPNHRSYIDFMLISCVFFLRSIPLPVIAATEDFLSMMIFGEAMRETGAFFIRRGSSVSDKLYWTILTCFIQQIILNSHHPIKYYIEGTRSRTGKFLHPKIGLLRMIAELYVKRKVADVLIVPLGITYERTLEENLYANELLGVPKPKESTGKLLKAWSVLNDEYGCVYMSVDQPMSLHQFWCCHGNAFATSSHIIPRQMQALNSDDIGLCMKFAKEVLKTNMANNIVVHSSHIIAFVLNQYIVNNAFKCHKFIAIKQSHLIHSMLKAMHVPCQEIELEKMLKIHRNLCKQQDDGHLVFDMKQIQKHVVISYYANQVLQMLVTPANICIALSSSTHKYTSTFLYELVMFMSQVMCTDFIYVPHFFEQEYAKSIDVLSRLNVVKIVGNGPILVDVQTANLISFNLYGYVITRKLICDYCQPSGQFIQDIISNALKMGTLLINNGFNDCRLLCKEYYSNAFSSLLEADVLSYPSSNDKQRKFVMHGSMFKSAREKLDVLAFGCKQFKQAYAKCHVVIAKL